jgi:transcriptional regulator with XRE-family HTH domain
MAVDFSIIGERIKRARKEKNMTQEDLSEKMDVSIAFLSRIERGSSQINLKRLSQICGILGVSEGEILNGTANNSSKYLDSEFSALLETCSSEQQKLIYDIAKVIANKK